MGMREYISKLIETNNLIIKDATMDECEQLQYICSTWIDKELLEGERFEENYIFKCLTDGDLPPVENASKEKYCLKSIYSKHNNNNNNIIGFVDIYHGYPNLYTLWISIFLLSRDIQNNGVGQEVIESLTKDAVETTYKKLGLAVHLKNWKALRFWTKTGFDKITGIYGDKDFMQGTYSLIGLEKNIR